MQTKFIYKLVSVCLSILCLNQNSYSQMESYYNPETFFLVKNPWFSTSNAAASSLFKKDTYLETLISYNNKSGDLKKITDPISFDNYSLDFFALKRVNGFTYMGSFKFLESFLKDKRWTYLMDADREIPYIIGDSIKSSFRKELLDVNISVSHSLFSPKLDAGIMFYYKSAIGVKDVDPRPINTLSKVSFTPSLLYKYSDFSRFAVSFKYCLRNEKIEVRKLTSTQSNLFLFSGLGFVSTETMLAAFNRSYNTYSREVELSFQYDDEYEFMTFSKLSFLSENTNIEDGKDLVKLEYCFLNREVSLKSFFDLQCEDLFHALIVDFFLSESLGIRNVINKERKDNYYEWKRYAEKDEYFKEVFSASVEYKLKFQTWQNNITLSGFSSREEYEFYPTVFFQDYNNIYLKYYINKSVKISNCTLNISASIVSRHNLYKASYLLDSGNATSFNVEDLSDEVLVSAHDNNFDYNTCAYISKSLHFQLDMPIHAFKQVTQTCFSVVYKDTKTRYFGNTRLLSLSLGIKL